MGMNTQDLCINHGLGAIEEEYVSNPWAHLGASIGEYFREEVTSSLWLRDEGEFKLGRQGEAWGEAPACAKIWRFESGSGQKMWGRVPSRVVGR